MNGKFAGKKGIIVKSSYENSKDKKYPHCLIVGLAKHPRRATKKTLRKQDEKSEKLEKLVSEGRSNNAANILNRMKKLGVFVKTYNMGHLLATRYFIYVID